MIYFTTLNYATQPLYNTDAGFDLACQWITIVNFDLTQSSNRLMFWNYYNSAIEDIRLD